MKNRYVLALIALLGIQQSCQAAAAVKNFLLVSTTVVSTGVAAALTGKFGTTAEAITRGLLVSPPAAPALDVAALGSAIGESLQPALASQQAQIDALMQIIANQQKNPSEFNVPYLRSVLTLINEHKVFSALIGSVGLGAVVCASHEGTRTIVRERFAALGTALNRLREQLMARMNGIEEQVAASTDALGSAINAVDANAVERLNALAAHQQQGFNQLAAQLALVTHQPAPEIAPAPVFTAQPIFTAPVNAHTTAPQGDLMDREQQGIFGRAYTTVCGWFSRS